MNQPVLVGKDEACKLNFIAPDGTTIPAPQGYPSSNVPSVNPWMSADGQSVRFTVPPTAGIAFTITWKDARGPAPAGFDDVSANFISRSVTGSMGPPVQQN